jgi:hypothetical protein
MRMIGFSTGALAKGNVDEALRIQGQVRLSAIEVSALREPELIEVMAGLARIDTKAFQYVSMHTPSELHSLSEAELVARLSSTALPAAFVVHPNIIEDLDAWHQLGSRMCIENMDQRKRVGRTADELRGFFNEFDEAGFCLDLGHAHQIDPTMGVAIELLDAFGSRLRHVHVSEVNPHGRHLPIGYTTRHAFESIADLIPMHVPIIIESVVDADAVIQESMVVEKIFNAAALRKAS